MAKIHPATTQAQQGDDSAGSPESQRYRFLAQTNKSKTLVLRDLLQDASEYQGLSNMGLYILYFIATIIFLGYNWSENTAVFHSSMMASYQAFGPEDWQQTAMANQNDMFTMYQYATGYVGQVLSDGQGRNLPLSQLHIDQYISVQLIRLVVDVESSCDYGTLNCYRTDPVADDVGGVNASYGLMPSGLWMTMERPAKWVYGSTAQLMFVTVYNATDGNATYDSVNATLQAVIGDTAFIGRFAMTMQLELYANYDMAWEPDSAACFSVAATLKQQVDASKMTAFKMTSSTSTLPLKTSFTTSFWDFARLLMLVLYLVFILLYLAAEVDEGRLAALQYATAAKCSIRTERLKNHKQAADAALAEAAFEGGSPEQRQAREHKYIRKMVRLGVWRYCTHPWNIVDILGTLLSLAWTLGWVYIIAACMWYKSTLTAWMASPENTNQLQNFSTTYVGFIYLGILNVLLVGLRLYKYMRHHSGMRIYYNLFIAAWRAIKDFGLWFIYVMLVLATVVIMVFQISGGNALFSGRGDGINSMALLTFGVMDYDTFTNSFQGIGSWSPVIVVLFWINIAILSTIALNIVIAIVCTAYADSCAKEGPIEFTLIYVVWLRLIFFGYYAWRVWIRRWSVERFVQSWVNVVAMEINLDEKSASHEFRYTKKYSWTTMKIARVFARWGLTLLPQTRILLAYFQDASSQALCVRSPWEDGEAVEEELTTVASLNKRHKGKKPVYQWTIDTAMTRGEFAAFMVALTASGCAGLPQPDGPSSKAQATQHDLGAPTYEELMRQKELLLSKEMMSVVGKAVGEAGQALSHFSYKALAVVMNEELAVLDDVLCHLADTRDATITHEKAAFDKADPETAPAKMSVDAWTPRDVPDGAKTWAAIVQAWHDAWDTFLARKSHTLSADPRDVYTRNSATLFFAGAAILRHGVALGRSISESLRPVLLFRAIARLGGRQGPWDAFTIAAIYAPWVWEVYSAELYADEDWNNELDDMDLKILDLREALAATIEEKLSRTQAAAAGGPGAGAPTSPSRMSPVGRPSSATTMLRRAPSPKAAGLQPEPSAGSWAIKAGVPGLERRESDNEVFKY